MTSVTLNAVPTAVTVAERKRIVSPPNVTLGVWAAAEQSRSDSRATSRCGRMARKKSPPLAPRSTAPPRSLAPAGSGLQALAGFGVSGCRRAELARRDAGQRAQMAPAERRPPDLELLERGPEVLLGVQRPVFAGPVTQ